MEKLFTSFYIRKANLLEFFRSKLEDRGDTQLLRLVILGHQGLL